jgi:hypothetical protein
MKLTRGQRQNLEEYFSRLDTPSRNSPVGNTMVRIFAKYPGISFEDARAKAHELLNTAAKSRIYRGPVILSAEELAERKKRMERVFRGQGNGKPLSKIKIPGDSSACVNTQTEVSRGSALSALPQALETAPIAISASSTVVGVKAPSTESILQRRIHQGCE